MSTITTLSAAALVAYLSMGSASDRTAPATASRSAERMLTVTPSDQHTAVTDTSHHPAVTMRLVVKPDGAPTTEPRPTQSLMAPMEVHGITPVAIDESQRQHFGLETVDGKGLSYLVKEMNGRYKRWIIPDKGWGVVTGKDEVPASNIFILNPVIVTDARGNRRMINYVDPNHSISMSRNTDEIDDSSTHTFKQQFKFKIVDSTNDPVSRLQSMLQFNTNDSVGARIQTQLHQAFNEIKEVSNDSTGTHRKENMRVMQMIINAGGDNKLPLEERERMMRNELPPEIREDDSMSTPMVKRIVRLNMNTIAKNGNDPNANTVPSMNHPFIFHIDGMKEVEETLFAKINTLVPILVRKATTVTRNSRENVDYDNGVIFWCEPSPELTQALTSQSVNEHPFNTTVTNQPVTTSTGALSNAQIYPNPAWATTTVHFTLAEPRMVAFSVHNILGKKMLDCGEVEYGAGEQSRTLSLDGLSDGMYMVVMTTDHGEQMIQRIVVRRMGE